MGAIASQITSLTIVHSTVYSDTDQRKHQSSASLAFVRGIHRGPVNSPHKWPVTRKMFPFDDVIMFLNTDSGGINIFVCKCNIQNVLTRHGQKISYSTDGFVFLKNIFETENVWPRLHYNDVIMSAMASQITSLTIVYSTVYSGADQTSIKAPRHWPLQGEFTGDRWISRTKGH